jgi:hypothetical protein
MSQYKLLLELCTIGQQSQYALRIRKAMLGGEKFGVIFLVLELSTALASLTL